MPKKPAKPHDEFFKATFGRREVALEYLQSMLPVDLQQDLAIEHLERVNGSFVSPALQEFFSDVVYQCPFRDGKHRINAAFILEHMQNPRLIFINLDEPHQQQDFIVFMLAYFLKNTEIAKEKIQDFIQTLPKVLNQSTMSTYDMIVKEGETKAQKVFEELLAKERQRLEEVLEQEHLRAEEERQRLNNTILNLHQIAKMPVAEIALMVSSEIEYIEALIAKSEEDKTNQN
jgi:hypothetical protein